MEYREREFGNISTAVGRLNLSILRNKILSNIRKCTLDKIDPLIYKTAFHIGFTIQLIKEACDNAEKARQNKK